MPTPNLNVQISINFATSINLLLDRSGSMASIAKDVEGGINTFIKEQKLVPGEATFTLVQFDTQDPQEKVFDNVNIKDVTEFKNFAPRGGTPLLDALGRLIVETRTRVAAVPEANRPKVVFVVYTDGDENSSTEFTFETIKKLVKEQTDLGWQFIFMGAEMDAFSQGSSAGFAASNTIRASKGKIGETYGLLSAKMANFRSSGKSEDFGYTVEERASVA